MKILLQVICIHISNAFNQSRTLLKNYEHSEIQKAELKKLDVKIRQACVSDTSPGVTCDGYSYGDACLDLFLWCRDDFVVRCSHGLKSDDH